MPSPFVSSIQKFWAYSLVQHNNTKTVRPLTSVSYFRTLKHILSFVFWNQQHSTLLLTQHRQSDRESGPQLTESSQSLTSLSALGPTSFRARKSSNNNDNIKQDLPPLYNAPPLGDILAALLISLVLRTVSRCFAL